MRRGNENDLAFSRADSPGNWQNKAQMHKNGNLNVAGTVYTGAQGRLVGSSNEYELRSASDKCLDVGSHGQGCDFNNSNKRYRIYTNVS